MSNICNSCSLQITKKSPGIQCSGFCRLHYHSKCVSMTLEQLKLLKSSPGLEWKCTSCQLHEIDSNQDDEMEPVLSPSNTQNDLPSFMLDLKKELMSLKSKQEELVHSLTFFSDKVTDFEKILSEVNKGISMIDKLKSENENLKKEVIDLNEKVIDLEQHARMDNIEIQGVPEKKGENITQIVTAIANTLEVDIKDKIKFAHRVQSFNSGSSKNIIVNFYSRQTKEEILSVAKERRKNGSSISGLSIEGISNRIFINEHLTSYNKILFKKTRVAAKNKNYKFVWIKNGKIFARQNETSRIKIIRNESHIKAL